MSLPTGAPNSPKIDEAATALPASDRPAPLKAIENPEYRSHESIKLAIEALTLCAMIFYGFVAYYQWRAMIIANQQTKTALHITQRAYITTDSPTFDSATKFINFFISNTGHIPSGQIEITVHEATMNSMVPNVKPDIETAVEASWQRHNIPSLPSGGNLVGFEIPVPESQALSTLRKALIRLCWSPDAFPTATASLMIVRKYGYFVFRVFII